MLVRTLPHTVQISIPRVPYIYCRNGKWETLTIVPSSLGALAIGVAAPCLMSTPSFGWAKTGCANCANCANRLPPVAGNIGGPRPATRVSASNVSQHLLRSEMRAQHGGRLVVGLEPLLQEA